MFGSEINMIIQLKQDFEKSELSTVKLIQRYPGNETVKENVPKCDGASFECVLYVLKEFSEATRLLDYDTGAELFPNFRKILADHARDEWDTLIEAIPDADRDEARFWETVELWKNALVSNDAKQSFVDYFLQLSKPRTMEV
jgi:hypothetical protein